ncbi:MAG: hypothetical protein OYM47_11095 [Gemmatimonadota bacterium]|nr:hypothetical protein [Gemmatimonadota bacterium]
MARIVKCGLADIISDLESISALDVCELGSGDTDDLFLCALGFEPRCLTLPCRLNGKGYKAKKAFYFKYSTNLEDNAVNLPELERHLFGIAATVEPIEADALDFANRFKSLLNLVVSDARNRAPKVTIDISVAANRLLLRCVRILLAYELSLRVIYSEAEVYHPSKSEYELNSAHWEKEGLRGLEFGVGDVIPSVDYPGDDLDPLPDSLILFPSFMPDRSKAVISSIDPSLLQYPGEKVIWLPGVPRLEQDCWRLEATKRLNGIGGTTRHFEICTFDYKETLQCLERLHSELSANSRITLSPLGSKMQALGTALFCYMHPDVRVILSSPKEYNAAQYSEGCKEVWKIDFGLLANLRRNLDEVGMLRIVDSNSN